MTDTTNQPAKAMWTRCNACQDRIYNNPHDIKIHRGHCPFELQMTIQKLTLAIFGTIDLPKGKEPLSNRLEELEQIVGDLDDHISTEPGLDPEAVDPSAWDAATEDTTDDFDDVLPTTPALPGATSYYTPAAIDRDDVDPMPSTRFTG